MGKSLLWFLVLQFFVLDSVWAFRLSPMVVELAPKGPKASTTFTIDNNSQEMIAVQLSMHKRISLSNGSEDRPAAEGFILYPEQLTLKAGEKRSVRLTYTQEPAPTSELPYRLIATQLPVNFQKKSDGKNESATGSVKFLLEYVASVYVRPPGVAAQVKLLEVGKIKDGKLTFKLKNEGTAHKLLTDLQIILKSSGHTFQPTSEDLKDVRTENLLPGAERSFQISVPKDFPQAELPKAEIRFQS